MVRAARIDEPRDLRLLGEEVRDLGRGLGLRATRSGSVSSPFSITQALNGLSDGPVWRRNLWTWSAMKFSVDEDDAAEATALSVDVLGRGIDHDVGAELQRTLQSASRTRCRR